MRCCTSVAFAICFSILSRLARSGLTFTLCFALSCRADFDDRVIRSAVTPVSFPFLISSFLLTLDELTGSFLPMAEPVYIVIKIAIKGTKRTIVYQPELVSD